MKVTNKEGVLGHTRLWQTVLGEIELTVSRASFQTWFQNTYLLEIQDHHVVIGVPNIFTKKQMEDKYHNAITAVLEKNGIEANRVEFKIHDRPAEEQKQTEDIVLPDNSSASSKDRGSNTQTISTNSPSALAQSKSGQLNSKYLFDTFIIGSGNELAHAACQAVTKHPGAKFNPLFIYGEPGLGKTHLVQAVGNGIRRDNPDARVFYITSEQFVKEFLDSIRYKKKGFSDKYRSADVLIVDDIQFIAGKERTEEEFFHTFNTLHQANKQIILSSDKPPRSISTLEERLRSRFEWGMTVDIQPPDFETRCAILHAKANSHGINLNSDTVEFLATHIQSNIRELEGTLNQVIAFCELKDIEPTADVAKSLLGGQRSQPRRLTAKQIVERTAKYFQVEMDEIMGPKRDKDIVVPRQIAMYLLRSELHMSFPKVARSLGRKDHTTAIHSVEKIEKNIHLDQSVRQHVNDIKERLYA